MNLSKGDGNQRTGRYSLSLDRVCAFVASTCDKEASADVLRAEKRRFRQTIPSVAGCHAGPYDAPLSPGTHRHNQRWTLCFEVSGLPPPIGSAAPSWVWS